MRFFFGWGVCACVGEEFWEMGYTGLGDFGMGDGMRRYGVRDRDVERVDAQE